MASYSAIKKECDEKNKARNVETRSSYSADTFWRQAGDRRFLISGGTKEQREEALLDKICHGISENTMPTIVLNGSAHFEKLFVSTMSRIPDADWIVFSEEDRDYHVGYGMSKENLKGFLYDRALKLFQNVNDQFNNYLDAFLTILEQYFAVSLPAMLHLSKYSDEEIAELGRRKEVENHKVDLIRKNPEAGATLRNLLGEMLRTFSMLTTKDCVSEQGLLTMEWENDSVALVQMNSETPEVLRTYFARILRQLKTKRRFRLILNGIPVQEDEELKDLILELRSNYEIVLGICDEDVFHMIGEKENLVSFPVQLIFVQQGNRGMTPTAQIEALGDYYYYEPTRGGGRGAELIQLIPTSEWGMAHEQRNRIRQEDYEGYEAVLKGVQGGKLFLVKKIK